MQKRFWHPLLALILFFMIPPMSFADGSGLFRAGMAAFKKGAYETAADYFQQARAAGLESPNLYYNLGSSFYKAGKYRDAKASLQLVADYPDWRHLAFYNLGRIAEVEGDQETAIAFYQKTCDADDTSKVAQLAAARLRELASDTAFRTAPRRWRGAIMTSVGYDDNVVQSPKNGDPGRIARTGDVFTDLYAYGVKHFRKNDHGGIRFDGGVFARLYAEEKDYRFASVFAGINRYGKFNGCYTQTGFLLDLDFIEDGFYAATPSLRLALKRGIGRVDLRAANNLAWIEAEKAYEYLSGLRNRILVELSKKTQNTFLRAGYEFEYNRRDNFQTEKNFLSYSPIRNKIYAGLDYKPARHWTINFRSEFRGSRYPDANRILLDDDGSETRKKRRDDRLVFSVQGKYEFKSTLDIFAKYDHTNNDSSFSGYAYNNNQITVGCRRYF